MLSSLLTGKVRNLLDDDKQHLRVRFSKKSSLQATPSSSEDSTNTSTNTSPLLFPSTYRYSSPNLSLPLVSQFLLYSLRYLTYHSIPALLVFGHDVVGLSFHSTTKKGVVAFNGFYPLQQPRALSACYIKNLAIVTVLSLQLSIA